MLILAANSANFLTACAAVMELVDMRDSKSRASNSVSVQFRPAAPAVKKSNSACRKSRTILIGSVLGVNLSIRHACRFKNDQVKV